MSIKAVPDVSGNGGCCDGIKDFVITAANWAGRMISNITSYIAELAGRVMQAAKPHFEYLKNFVQENKEMVLIGGAIFAGGALIATAFNYFCCSTPTTTPPPAGP